MLRRIAAAKSVAETSVHDDVMDAVRRMQLVIRDGTSKQRSLLGDVGEVSCRSRRSKQTLSASLAEILRCAGTL